MAAVKKIKAALTANDITQDDSSNLTQQLNSGRIDIQSVSEIIGVIKKLKDAFVSNHITQDDASDLTQQLISGRQKVSDIIEAVNKIKAAAEAVSDIQAVVKAGQLEPEYGAMLTIRLNSNVYLPAGAITLKDALTLYLPSTPTFRKALAELFDTTCVPDSSGGIQVGFVSVASASYSFCLDLENEWTEIPTDQSNPYQFVTLPVNSNGNQIMYTVYVRATKSGNDSHLIGIFDVTTTGLTKQEATDKIQAAVNARDLEPEYGAVLTTGLNSNLYLPAEADALKEALIQISSSSAFRKALAELFKTTCVPKLGGIQIGFVSVAFTTYSYTINNQRAEIPINPSTTNQLVTLRLNSNGKPFEVGRLYTVYVRATKGGIDGPYIGIFDVTIADLTRQDAVNEVKLAQEVGEIGSDYAAMLITGLESSRFSPEVALAIKGAMPKAAPALSTTEISERKSNLSNGFLSIYIVLFLYDYPDIVDMGISSGPRFSDDGSITMYAPIAEKDRVIYTKQQIPKAKNYAKDKAEAESIKALDQRVKILSQLIAAGDSNVLKQTVFASVVVLLMSCRDQLSDAYTIMAHYKNLKERQYKKWLELKLVVDNENGTFVDSYKWMSAEVQMDISATLSDIAEYRVSEKQKEYDLVIDFINAIPKMIDEGESCKIS